MNISARQTLKSFFLFALAIFSLTSLTLTAALPTYAYDKNSASDVAEAARKNAQRRSQLQSSLEGVGKELADIIMRVDEIENIELPNSKRIFEQTTAQAAATQDLADKTNRRLDAAQKDRDLIENRLRTSTTIVDQARAGLASSARQELQGDDRTNSVALLLNADDTSNFVSGLQAQAIAEANEQRLLGEASQDKATSTNASVRLEQTNDLIADLKAKADAQNASAQAEREAAEAQKNKMEKLDVELKAKKADLKAKEAQVRANLAAAKAEEDRIAAEMAKLADGNWGFDGSGGVFQYPVNPHQITSPYGARSSPCRGCSSFHKGTDFGVSCGTPVYATAGGKMEHQYSTAGGNTAVISHGEHNGSNYASRYLHLSKFVASGWVNKGQLIAYSGNTGTATTGCHLHFEMWKNGSAVNPLSVINSG